MRIIVIGAGGWGTALAVSWRLCGRDVTLWTPFTEEREALRRDRENRRFLPGVPLPPDLPIENDPAAATSAGLVVFAVPSQHLRDVAGRIMPHLPEDALIVSAAKGLERRDEGFPLRMSEVLTETAIQAGRQPAIVVLSGPSHAEEVGRKMPTAIVAAGAAAARVRDLCATPWLRLYTSNDPVGVELGGALKNPIAIAAGIAAGLGGGDNALGALVTRGMVEVARLGVMAGADERTFAGLSGIGDLVTTCISRHSRNRQVGLRLAAGESLDAILSNLGMVAEGVSTARVVDEWARESGQETPIISSVARVMFQGAAPREELEKLMTRALKSEFN